MVLKILYPKFKHDKLATLTLATLTLATPNKKEACSAVSIFYSLQLELSVFIENSVAGYK